MCPSEQDRNIYSKVPYRMGKLCSDKIKALSFVFMWLRNEMACDGC